MIQMPFGNIYIGKIGVGNDRLSKIPMEMSHNGSLSCDKYIVLDKWKNSFCDLLNKPNSISENVINNNYEVFDVYLNCEF